MSRIKLWFSLIAISLLFTGCYEKYISADGESLLPYFEPSELQNLIVSTLDASTDVDPDIWIIDVRPDDNYKKGHIPTAKSFSSSSVMSRLDELPKTKYLIVYCETGGRAQAVIKQLEKEGYTKMMNWGGYTRWPFELVPSN